MLAIPEVWQCYLYFKLSLLQLICDADQRIIGIDAGHGGAHQDSTVWDTSEIGTRIVREKLLGEYYILGDNGLV